MLSSFLNTLRQADGFSGTHMKAEQASGTLGTVDTRLTVGIKGDGLVPAVFA